VPLVVCAVSATEQLDERADEVNKSVSRRHASERTGSATGDKWGSLRDTDGTFATDRVFQLSRNEEPVCKYLGCFGGLVCPCLQLLVS